ncbi:MAG: ribosome maturation factor RimP [Eubacteriales bacterium]|nr:ribosome maturation factor RimP [Eubacteriales bacterium]
MRKRSKSEEKLFLALEESVDKLGLDLVDLQFAPAGKKTRLTIYLDKRGGVNIDELGEASQILDPLVEELGYTGHDYFTLSSPGLDRPLITDKDFSRHQGEKLLFKFYQKQEGEKSWEAILMDFDQDTFKLKYQNAEHNMPRQAVAQVKQIIEF